jgi:hypothetical protein
LVTMYMLRAIMYVVEIILTLLLSRIAQNTFIRVLQFKVTAKVIMTRAVNLNKEVIRTIKCHI